MIRILGKILPLLLLGAIVNVAVAWLCAGVAPLDGATEQLIYTMHPELNALWIARSGRRSFGFTQSVTRLQLAGTWGVGGYQHFLEWPEAPLEQEMVYLKPRESFDLLYPDIIPRIMSSELTPGLLAIAPWPNAAGWPCRSLACWYINLTGVPSKWSWCAVGPVTLEWGIQVDRPLRESNAHTLPYYPLLLGFIFNMVFYAVVLFVMVRIARVVHRWNRLRRGLCPACAYPIGSSPVCTECGTSLALFRHTSCREALITDRQRWLHQFAGEGNDGNLCGEVLAH